MSNGAMLTAAEHKLLPDLILPEKTNNKLYNCVIRFIEKEPWLDIRKFTWSPICLYPYSFATIH